MLLLANAERLGWEAIAAALAPHPDPLIGDHMKNPLRLLRAEDPTAAEARQALTSLPIATAADELETAEYRPGPNCPTASSVPSPQQRSACKIVVDDPSFM